MVLFLSFFLDLDLDVMRGTISNLFCGVGEQLQEQ
jgi:hypothetical protein